MRPPVIGLDRQAGSDPHLMDLQIRKGDYVYPAIIVSHYDKRYWKEPFTFRPERLDPANRANEPSRPAFAFVPFSAGARNCIGRKFAMMEATLAWPSWCLDLTFGLHILIKLFGLVKEPLSLWSLVARSIHWPNLPIDHDLNRNWNV